jgi:hypothetical protein
MALKSPEIRSFVGSTHGQYVEELKQLDIDRLKLARDRVRSIHAEQTTAAKNAHPDQEALVKQEAAKMRRFKLTACGEPCFGGSWEIERPKSRLRWGSSPPSASCLVCGACGRLSHRTLPHHPRPAIESTPHS